MKAIKSLLAALLLFGSSAEIAFSQSNLTNGLVAYYPFDGNANDASGNANNGTVSNAQLTNDRFGITNSAYQFNGTNSAILFPGAPLTNIDNWTLTAWMNPAVLPQQGVALTVGHDGASPYNGYWLMISGGGSEVPGTHPSAGYPTVGMVDSAYSLPTNGVWYHVVMLRESGVTKFYVNGSQTPGTGAIAPIAPTGLTIGSMTGANFFNGALDDVRIYNRALSSNEVSQLYQYESAPRPCFPHAATATATVVNEFVVAINVTDPSCGYTNPPYVQILGGGGTGAGAYSTVSNGSVVSITVTNAGFGYTNVPIVTIAAPPFTPSVSIAVSKVLVTMHVTLGHHYVLESSSDLVTWTPVGPPFTATSETISQEFAVQGTGQFFRIREVP
jgi:hypothetical protein